MWLFALTFLLPLVAIAQQRQGTDHCHPYMDKERPAETCAHLTLPTGLCSTCGLGPMQDDGMYVNCKMASGLGKRNYGCMNRLEEYVRLNPCDTARAQDLVQLEDGRYSRARSRLDYFLYSICENACDCIPQYGAHRFGEKTIDLKRGNCQAHTQVDVCRLFPNIQSIVLEGQEPVEGPAVCPYIDDWYWHSGDAWNGTHATFMEHPVTTVEPGVVAPFLTALVHASEIQMPNTLWSQCILLETNQKRIVLAEDMTDSPVATASPTKAPTVAPTKAPTASPTREPTTRPTIVPTAAPSKSPTLPPTESPTESPSESPSVTSSARPSAWLSMMPSSSPTKSPTQRPSVWASLFPSSPLVDVSPPTPPPSPRPSASPTASPTKVPTASPTKSPTRSPTKSPTRSPTAAPTVAPTKAPTASPTKSPTHSPSASPTNAPTTFPTNYPTLLSDELTEFPTTRSDETTVWLQDFSLYSIEKRTRVPTFLQTVRHGDTLVLDHSDESIYGWSLAIESDATSLYKVELMCTGMAEPMEQYEHPYTLGSDFDGRWKRVKFLERPGSYTCAAVAFTKDAFSVHLVQSVYVSFTTQ